jgi:Glyoxalase/Bleomycin resistance protein/Dioxygenase superfamily
MDRFSFGVRDNGIIQIAYTVADIQEAMRHYSELLQIGPWFLVGPFVPPKGVYRGVTTTMQVSLAIAFSGQTMIELIQQHDDKPSVFSETLKARGAHGFHHWAIGTRDFEKTVAHYRSLGYAEAFSDTAPMGFRVVYFDTTRDLPGMLEVIEMNAMAEQGFQAMYLAARDWDGKTHIVNQIRTAPP